MENTGDFDHALAKTVDHYERQLLNIKLTGVWLAAQPPFVRERSQRFDAIVNHEGRAAGLIRAKMSIGIVANMREIVNGGLRPANPH
jgi:hypothetical protein